jgi:hypothetical protein
VQPFSICRYISHDTIVSSKWSLIWPAWDLAFPRYFLVGNERSLTRKLRVTNMQKFNRFTTLPVLLDMLGRRKLAFLDPSTWEDKNDSEVMAAYKQRKGLQSLLALCGSSGDETIHHWKTFADGISGCCVEFDLAKLAPLLDGTTGVRHAQVTYKKLRDLKDESFDLEQMPFTKRWPYRCEDEYRILWEGQTATTLFEIEFDLKMINKVTVSQRMPEQIYSTIRNSLRAAFKDPDQRISRSTIYQNKTWIGKFTKA